MLNKFGEETTQIENTNHIATDAEIANMAQTPVEGMTQSAPTIDIDGMMANMESLKERFAGMPTEDIRDRLEYANLDSTARLMVASPDRFDPMQIGAVFEELNNRRFIADKQSLKAFEVMTGTERDNVASLKNFLDFSDRLSSLKNVDEQQKLLRETFASPALLEWEAAKAAGNEGELATRKIDENPRAIGDTLRSAGEWANPNGWLDYWTQTKDMNIDHPRYRTQERDIEEYEHSLSPDKLRAAAAQYMPYLTKSQRDLVNLAASGADMNGLRGVFNLMKKEDRDLIMSMCQAVRPSFDGNFLEEMGVRAGLGIRNTYRGSRRVAYAGLESVSRLLGVDDQVTSDTIRKQLLADIEWADAMSDTKLKDPEGFLDKALKGLADSSSVQYSMLFGAGMKSIGKSVGNPIAKAALTSGGAILEGYTALSMIGDQFNNMLLNGVPLEKAAPLSIAFGAVDTWIETMNLGDWFGKSLTPAQMKRIGLRAAFRTALKKDGKEFLKVLGTNATQAFRITVSEAREELLQGINQELGLSVGQGQSLMDAFSSSETYEKGMQSFYDALPTCTAFGFFGAANPTGSVAANADAAYNEHLKSIEGAVAKRKGLGEITDANAAMAERIAKNEAARVINATKGMKTRKEKLAWINAQTEFTPAEKMFYAEHLDMYDASVRQDGEVWADAFLSGSVNEAIFARAGWKFSHNERGEIDAVTTSTGETIPIEFANRLASIDDLDEGQIDDFVEEYNRLADEGRFKGEHISSANKEEIAKAAPLINGFYRNGKVTLFGARAHTGTLAHESTHALVDRLAKVGNDESRLALRALANLLNGKVTGGKLSLAADEHLAENAEHKGAAAAIKDALTPKDRVSLAALAENIVTAAKKIAGRGKGIGFVPVVRSANGQVFDPSLELHDMVRKALAVYQRKRDLEAAKAKELKEAAEKAEQDRINAKYEAEFAALEEEERETEAARKAEELRQAKLTEKMTENRKRATKKMPRLLHNKNLDGEGAQRARAAYGTMWKAKTGKQLTDADVAALGETYGLPPEAVGLERSGKGWKLSTKPLVSDEGMAKFADGLIRLWTDVKGVKVVVPDVVVATAEDAANAVPNEVYEPVTDTFIQGRIVIDANAAKSFREQAGMEEPSVTPEQLAQAKANHPTRFSFVTPAEDVAYADAATRYSIVTPEQARLWMPNTKVVDEHGLAKVVYHGTTQFGFTRFDPKKSDDGSSFFFTDRLGTARTYSGVDDVREIGDKDYEGRPLELAKKRLFDSANDLYFKANKHFPYSIDFEDAYNLIKNYAGKVAHGEMSFDKAYGEMYDDLTDYVARLWKPTAEYEEFAEWQDSSEEWGDIVDSIEEAVAAVKSYDDAINESNVRRGNYQFYLNLVNPLVIDAKGSNWKSIDTSAVGKEGGGKVKTREVSKYAKGNGYDGVIIKNLIDYGPKAAPDGEPATIYIAFSPTQIKSADGTTFDDNGNPIPMEERGNPANPDIRWSVVTPAEDAAYADAVARGDRETALRMIREAAAKAMPNTKVVGKDGLPLVVYHGTSRTFWVFRKDLLGSSTGSESARMAFFFTEKEEEAASYHGGVSAFTSIEIPYRKSLEGSVQVVYRELVQNNRLAAVIKGRKTPEELARVICDRFFVGFDSHEMTDAQKEIIDRVEFDPVALVTDTIKHLVADANFDVRDYVAREFENRFGTILNKIMKEDIKKHNMRVFLDIGNPLVVDYNGKSYAEIGDYGSEESKELGLVNVLKKAKRRVKGERAHDGVVFDNTSDNGGRGGGYDKPHKIFAAFSPSQIKSADITYDDAGALIPLSQRFNPANADTRWSMAQPNGRQKQANTAYPDASKDIRAMRDDDIRFSFKDDARALILKKRPDVPKDNLSLLGDTTNDGGQTVDDVVTEIMKFPDSKSRKAALNWFVKGAIKLPEDAPKVTEALSYAESAKGKANTDPFAYDSPMAMIDALHDFKPKAKPINPDKVPQLTDRREMGNGVVTYLVQDDREGQQAMREIINTHWGEDANPWCLLQGDGYGHLSDGSNGSYDAWYYWNHYNALPKRVAFKDGKLLAFMATDEAEGYTQDDFDERYEEIIHEYIESLDEEYGWDSEESEQYRHAKNFIDNTYFDDIAYAEDIANEAEFLGLPKEDADRLRDIASREEHTDEDEDEYSRIAEEAKKLARDKMDEAEESWAKWVRDNVTTYTDENGLEYVYSPEGERLNLWRDEYGEYTDFFNPNSGKETWWDRQDSSHEGIPLGNMPVPNDPRMSADFEIRDGVLTQVGESKPNGKVAFSLGDVRNAMPEGYDGVDEYGRTRFSISTYEGGGRDTLIEWLFGKVGKDILAMDEKQLAAYKKLADEYRWMRGAGKTAFRKKLHPDFIPLGDKSACGKGSISIDEAVSIIRETDRICKIAKDLANTGKYAHFSNWSTVTVETDKDGNPIFGVVRPNGDYAYNLDFSTICKKRRPLDHVFASLVEDGTITDANIDILLAETNIPRIQDIIKRHGLEVACALCFVDSKRYKIGEVAKNFSKLYNGILDLRENNPKRYNELLTLAHKRRDGKSLEKDEDTGKMKLAKPTFYDRALMLIDEDPSARQRIDSSMLISGKGMDDFARKFTSIHNLYRSFGGVSKAKDAHADVPWNNDIIRPFAHYTNPKSSLSTIHNQGGVEKAYSVGGVRLQSFTDFIPALFFDYAQMVAELSAMHLPMHTYTKEADFVKLFGKTGMKMNMSLVPGGTGVLWLTEEEGKKRGLHPIWGKGSKVGKTPKEDVIKLVKKDGKVAFFDLVDECFPIEQAFDLRRGSRNVGTIMVGVTDEHIKLMLNDPRIDMVIPYHQSSLNADVKLMRKIDKYEDYTDYQTTKRPDGAKDFDFYGDLAKTHDPRKTARNYLDFCAKNKYRAKFTSSSRGTDFSANENYYKLLADFRLFDDAGDYAPQGAVTPTYPTNLVELLKDALSHDQRDMDALDRETEPIKNEIRQEIFKMGDEFVDAKTAVNPNTPSDRTASYSIGDRSAGNVAKFILARDIMEAKGKIPDTRRAAQVAASVGYRGNLAALINDAEAEAKSQTEVLNYIASDPKISKVLARAGLAVRNANAVNRARAAAIQFSREVSEAAEGTRKATERAVRMVRGEDYEQMKLREGLDMNAILLAIRPPVTAEPAEGDGEAEEKPAHTPVTLNAAERAAVQEAAAKAVARGAELVKKAKDEIAKSGQTAADRRREERESGKAHEPTADEEYGNAVSAAFAQAIAEAGLTLDSPEAMVALVKAITEKYVKGFPAEFGEIDPTDIFASPIVRAKFAANIASFASAVADAYAPSYARVRVERNAQMLNDKGLTSMRSIEEVGEMIFRDLHADVIRQSRAGLIKNIKKILKPIAKHYTENEMTKDRKVSSRLGMYCKIACRVIDLSADAVEERAQELEDKLNTWSGMSESEAGKYREFDEMKMELEMLDMFGNLRGRMPSELAALRDYVEQIVNEDKFDTMTFGEKWEQSRASAAAAITGAIEGDPSRKGVMPEDTEVGGLYSLIGMWENKAHQLTRWCKDTVRRNTSLKAFGAVEEMLQGAADREINYTNSQREKFVNLVKSVYGGEAEAAKALSADIDESLWPSLDRGDQHTQWTVGRLLQMYVSIVQSDYTENCAKWGRDDAYRTQVEGIINSLDPRHMDFIRGMRQLYMEMGDDLSEVMERTTGTMLRTPNRDYMPVKMLRDHHIGSLGSARAYSPFAPSLTPRVRNGLDFDQTVDIIDLWESRVRDTAHTIGYGDVGSMVQGICLSDDVLKAIRQGHGQKVMRQWNRYILDILAGVQTPHDADDVGAKTMRFFARLASRTWLMLNPASWAKQLAAIPCFALSDEGSLWKVTKSLAFCAMHPQQAAEVMRDLSRTKAFQARYGIAISQEMSYATTGNRFESWIDKLVDFGMSGTMKFDALGVYTLAEVYHNRRCELESNGMSADEASETAAAWLMHIVDKTAQSTRTLNTTELQRAGGAWGLLLQFKSAPAQQTQFELGAWQDWSANKSDAARLKKAIVITLINHIIVPTINTAIESLVAGLTSWGIPDDEKRKRLLEMWIANVISGSLGSIVFLGTIVEGVTGILGKTANGEPISIRDSFGETLPATGVVNLWMSAGDKALKAMGDITDGDIQDGVYDLVKAISSVIPGLSWVSRKGFQAYESATDK